VKRGLSILADNAAAEVADGDVREHDRPFVPAADPGETSGQTVVAPLLLSARSVIATGISHSVRDLVEIAFSRAGLDWQKYVKTDPKFLRPAEVCGYGTRVGNWQASPGAERRH
jgi:hypothetical protein